MQRKKKLSDDSHSLMVLKCANKGVFSVIVTPATCIFVLFCALSFIHNTLARSRLLLFDWNVCWIPGAKLREIMCTQEHVIILLLRDTKTRHIHHFACISSRSLVKRQVQLRFTAAGKKIKRNEKQFTSSVISL